MSAALATSTFAVARKLSGPSRLPRQQCTSVQAVASSEGLNADSCVVEMAVARRAGLALGATAASLATVAPPAYAMEGVLSVFNGNPALVRMMREAPVALGPRVASFRVKPSRRSGETCQPSFIGDARTCAR